MKKLVHYCHPLMNIGIPILEARCVFYLLDSTKTCFCSIAKHNYQSTKWKLVNHGWQVKYPTSPVCPEPRGVSPINMSNDLAHHLIWHTCVECFHYALNDRISSKFARLLILLFSSSCGFVSEIMERYSLIL